MFVELWKEKKKLQYSPSGQCKFTYSFANYGLFEVWKFRIDDTLPVFTGFGTKWLFFISVHKKIKCLVNVLTALKKPLKITSSMFLPCYFLSGINVLKISLFKCKNISLLEESILRSNKTYILGLKLFLKSYVLLSLLHHVRKENNFIALMFPFLKYVKHFIFIFL